jgi:hypothetical protein
MPTARDKVFATCGAVLIRNSHILLSHVYPHASMVTPDRSAVEWVVQLRTVL